MHSQPPQANSAAAAAVKARYDANFRHLVWEILFFGIGFAAISRFLSVFGIRLGADATELSLMAALPALILLFSSGFGTWWLRKFSSSVIALVWPGFFFRLVFLLPALAPFFAPHLQVWWLIIGTALTALPQGLAAIAFVVMMREAIPPTRMTTLLSQRSVALNVGLAVAALAFGVWLEIIPFPINYQLMFVIAFLFGLLSWRETLLIRLNAQPDAHAQQTPSRPPPPTSVGSPWKIRSFYPVIIAIAVSHIGFHSINALLPLHLVNELDASEGFIAVFGMVELLAAVGVSLLTPHISERIGTRAMMAVGMVLLAASSGLIALTPVLWPTLIGAALTGAAWTMTAVVGLFAYFNELTTPEEMTVLSGPYHQVIGVAVFIGPLIGSALSGLGLPLITVLLIGSVLRLIGAPMIDPALFRIRRAGAPAPTQPDRTLCPGPSPTGD